MPKPVSLTSLNLGTRKPAATTTPITIQPGDSRPDGNGWVSFMCASGGDPCEVTVAADGTVTATGGTVTAHATTALTNDLATQASQASQNELRIEANKYLEAAEKAADGLSNSSTDADRQAAQTAYEEAKTKVDAAKDLPDYNSLKADLNRVKTTLDTKGMEHRAYKNDKVKPYVTAINGWKVSPTLKTLPKVTTGLSTENKNGTTMIKLRRASNRTEITGRDKIKVTGLPSGLTAYKFTADDKNYGTVFTTHGDPETKGTTYTWYRLLGVATTDLTTDVADLRLFPRISYDPVAQTVSIVTADRSAPNAKYKLHKDDITLEGFEGNEYTLTSNTPGTIFGIKGNWRVPDGNTKLTVDKDGFVTVDKAIRLYVNQDQRKELANHSFTLRRTKSDADYMHFGYWVTTGGTAAKPTKMIDTFGLAAGYATTDNATGLVQTTDSASQLRGRATYSGNAAGIYVFKTGTVGDEDLSNGEFTAKANLTAQFGELRSGTVAAKDQYIIKGTISDFKPMEGSHDLSRWSLTLNEADLGAPGDSSTSRRTSANQPLYSSNAGLQSFTGTTSGGGGGAGAWQGNFYGGAGTGLDNGQPRPDGADTNIFDTANLDADDAKFDDYPLAVVGEFNGHFSNGHVVGAFGAEKD